MDVEQGDVRERRPGDRRDAEVDRADEQADERGPQQEEGRAEDRQASRRGHFAAATAFAPCATVRMNWTMRGPQRDATSSLTPTTW